ncbi:GNAT family N-acetyltransferase [Christiangramia sabulilitoris]|uniref:GNAT family N-acetyltransferase n=1 Tax=Christiangramia sabulilitoris TaxID=2583991 RepID=A0A550I2A6_9FLAO|nr:GNAT family N-acetyltransferase [Christiangramia sabulilitoris]TRO65106.1 GNAT family N-acetyltransferase [Christiangramia sabulilitoris]
MNIREASQSDIPDIIKVLKASLGEGSSEKTEKVWRYKHIDNPFGESLILVAEEKNEIIGVRAFMRWNWQKGDKVYSAFRAVDTATHPDHQGKGIFKKLTLNALAMGKERGDHFVFNTPNAQSKPGYLKMGWKEISKLRIHVIPVNPFYWKKEKEIMQNFSNDVPNEFLDLDKWNEDLIGSDKVFTPKGESYLNWRYVNNPMQSYFIKSNSEYFIAGYVKIHKNFKEFRISELLFTKDASRKTIKKIIMNWAKKFGVQFVSLNVPLEGTIFKRSLSGGLGPVLTFKLIDENLDQNMFLKFKSWEYSLGDLELF